jgi:hypothetical protein
VPVSALFAVSIESGNARIATSPLRELCKREGPDGVKDLRIVPLLYSDGRRDPDRTTRIAVGYCRLLQLNSGALKLSIVLQDSWKLEDIPVFIEGVQNDFQVLRQVHGAGQKQDVQEMESSAQHDLEKLVNENALHGGEYLLPRVAKTLGESSRDVMTAVRDLRYKFESGLALSSLEAHASDSYTHIVASLLQINVLCGRASDRARDASREGLWVYLCDREVYHSYRKLQDPTILNDFEPATFGMRPWIRSHDAGIRQCVQLQQQAEMETIAIQSLISSATGISSSREADAQSRFNLLVALLSIGIGIPGLFLAMYGASELLPLDSMGKLLLFAPVLVSLLGAAVIAWWKAPRGRLGKLWKQCAALTVVICAFMVGCAWYFQRL